MVTTFNQKSTFKKSQARFLSFLKVVYRPLYFIYWKDLRRKKFEELQELIF